MVSTSLSSLVTLIGALAVSALPHQKRAALPDYVITYAPYSYLYSGEGFWPSDLAIHIQHVQPAINFKVVNSTVTLETLSSYGSNVDLTSKDNQLNAAKIPWMVSEYGKPDSTGRAAAAPATIIAVEKPGGIVDAFYFYFYSYNLAPEVLISLYYGDHVGDWEHSMVRFINGIPTYFYLSQHSGGAAYDFSAIPKTKGRPISYIAHGSHANYPTAGIQRYADPLGIVHDTTSKGVPWDVTLNYRGYWYDVSSQVFTSSGGAGLGASEQPGEGVGWLSFTGEWGDAQWPINEPGQYCISSECHISNGPTGPFLKNLGRTAVCQNEASCTIKDSI